MREATGIEREVAFLVSEPEGLISRTMAKDVLRENYLARAQMTLNLLQQKCTSDYDPSTPLIIACRHRHNSE